VALGDGQALPLGPAAVAVHDDRDGSGVLAALLVVHG
jgi:hypothetical protein